MEQFYTVEEVATTLKVDPRTVRAEIRAGELKASRVGRNFRISESNLNEYLGGRV